MQAVELFDEVFVERAKEFSLLMEPNDIALEMEDNLAYKAAVLMSKNYGMNESSRTNVTSSKYVTNILPNISIRINKRIPVEAGLAGSSTDAAAAIISLVELWNLNVDLAELCKLGAGLGADIPFCLIANAKNNPCRYSSDALASSTALAEGIGDILTPLPSPGGALIIVKPKAALSTQRVYSVYDHIPEKAAHPDTDGFLNELRTGKITAGASAEISPVLTSYMVNALQYAALSESAETAEILATLKSLLPQATVFMSGSGSAVVAYFTETTDAKTALPYIQRKFETGGVKVFFTPLLK
jgi:4-diphosphocytidyl-2-C-methyl-D-erythritol kinase